MRCAELNILCVYVDGGKGHYIPAKAVQEQLEALGHNAVLVDFFHLLNIRFIGKVNKYVWRKLLEHSSYEMKFSSRNDQNTREIRAVSRILRAVRMRQFRRVVAQYKPDMIFTTHPYPEYFLADLSFWSKANVPVTYYATDVFALPRSAVQNRLKAMYIATEEGCQSAIEGGQNPDTVRLCPFPLQASCFESSRLTKSEARSKLSLKQDIFTLQVNFGGEGVGATSLLKALKDIKVPVQVLIIGGIEDRTRQELERIISDYPDNITAHLIGFVSNVNDYLMASDMLAGRSGINTLVEAFYFRRPFLITELVYTVISSAAYVEKYKVGWNAAADVEKQIEVIKQIASQPALLDEIDKNFDKIPIRYSARKLAKMIIEDCRA